MSRSSRGLGVLHVHRQNVHLNFMWKICQLNFTRKAKSEKSEMKRIMVKNFSWNSLWYFQMNLRWRFFSGQIQMNFGWISREKNLNMNMNFTRGEAFSHEIQVRTFCFCTDNSSCDYRYTLPLRSCLRSRAARVVVYVVTMSKAVWSYELGLFTSTPHCKTIHLHH